MNDGQPRRRYVLLTGARKNAGDYLIAHCARRLLLRHAPVNELLELHSLNPLDDNHLALINASCALIICGGPVIQPSLGERICPFAHLVDRIKVPIIGFGVGWRGPGDDHSFRSFKFGAKAKPLLHRLRGDFGFVGCRDQMTCELLQRHGFRNAILTGCPSWFEPEYYGKTMTRPSSIRSVVITPAEHPMYERQSERMLRCVRAFWPDADMTCSFHRGWTPAPITPLAHAQAAQRISQKARQLDMKCVDISGSAEGLLAYPRYDLHVGYRVHAHYRMLAARKPSLLIAEDGRGLAALETMRLPGLLGWKGRSGFGLGLRNWIRKTLSPSAGPTSDLEPDPGLGDRLQKLLEQQQAENFGRLTVASAFIDGTWSNMETMLKAMPGDNGR